MKIKFQVLTVFAYFNPLHLLDLKNLLEAIKIFKKTKNSVISVMLKDKKKRYKKMKTNLEISLFHLVLF